MKWFKHLSGSLSNSFIFELIEEHGSDGYLVFFGTLELMSDEFDVFNPGYNCISIKKLQKSFQLSRQRIIKIFRAINQKSIEKLRKTDRKLAENCEKTDRMKQVHQILLDSELKKIPGFLCRIDKTEIEVICIRLKELCDEHTRKMLPKKSGVNQELVRSKSGVSQEQEAEAEADLSKKAWNVSKMGANNELLFASLKKIKNDIKSVSADLVKDKIFVNVDSFVGKMRKQKVNERAILHSLIRCKIKSSFEVDPWAYCLKIIKVENGNYNEKENQRIKG